MFILSKLTSIFIVSFCSFLRNSPQFVIIYSFFRKSPQFVFFENSPQFVIFLFILSKLTSVRKLLFISKKLTSICGVLFILLKLTLIRVSFKYFCKNRSKIIEFLINNGDAWFFLPTPQLFTKDTNNNHVCQWIKSKYPGN